MTWRMFFGLAAALCLLGCSSNSEIMQGAVDQARAACEAQGKQFILKSRPRMEAGDLFDHDVSVDADCVGPGDPGYRASKTN